MRKKSLFLVAIGALLLGSCSNDEENLAVKSGTPATLSLTLTGTNADTRALGSTSTPTLIEENKIQTIVVGLFKTDNSTDVIYELSYPSGYTASTPINVTGRIIQGSGDSGFRNIIVVANAPNNHFSGIATKSAFENRVIALTQTKDKLPMTGTATVTLQANQTVNLTTPIPITRLVARINLISLKTDFESGGQYASSTFHADEIFLYNAMSNCTVNGVYTDPVHGWVSTPPYHGVTGLYDDVNLATPINYPSTTGDFHYFYTFPNLFPASITQSFLDGPFTGYTRLVIGGTFDVDGDGSTLGDQNRVYYPVIVNRVGLEANLNIPAGIGIGVKRNTVYKVAVTIKNKGVDNPEIVIDPAFLKITVTPQDWDVTIPEQIVIF